MEIQGDVLSTKILLVDDEPDILRLTQFLLESWGFEVITASSGVSAIAATKANSPGLILMDVNMEQMNGFEACAQLKNNFETSSIPIIMLTSQDQIHSKITGLDKGADDYVIKTVDPLELRARIEMVIRRTQEQSSISPLTRLPGNMIIDRVIKRHVEETQIFSVCYCDLDNFKAYNDKYGYQAGDQILVRTAEILMHSVRQEGNLQDFVGHIGGDDFVLVTTPDREDAICSDIIQRLDAMIPEFYNHKDRMQKCIQVTNREGRIQKFPLMTITIAVVNNIDQIFTSSLVIAERAAELKKYLKHFPGSNYLSERRSRQSKICEPASPTDILF